MGNEASRAEAITSDWSLRRPGCRTSTWASREASKPQPPATHSSPPAATRGHCDGGGDSSLFSSLFGEVDCIEAFTLVLLLLPLMVIAALCALAFLAPAVLYGLYRAVRWLAWLLLYAALRPSARGAAGGVTEAGSGGHRLTGAAGDGVNVGVGVAGGGGNPLGVGLESSGVATAAAAAATGADIPTFSVPSLLWYLLGLPWQAYLSFVLAIAATAIAIAAVRRSYEVAEAAVRRVLPPAGSELGALLHARAQRPRLRGGVFNGEFIGSCGFIFVIAVILRWLGGTSFWTLLCLLAAIWAPVEAMWLVEEYRQQQRVGASRRDGSPPAGPPRRAVPSGDGVAQPPTQQPAPQVLPSGGGGDGQRWRRGLLRRA
ncbi:hypothetical protein PLESTF_001809100 [Pleodorina starrii]|nr:hypothetical protein PLESTM_001809200 [Pleodorina starrii]GLC76644.1 hypothetical protein PLESTF_001809100 [Pleodorina starrii]